MSINATLVHFYVITVCTVLSFLHWQLGLVFVKTALLCCIVECINVTLPTQSNKETAFP